GGASGRPLPILLPHAAARGRSPRPAPPRGRWVVHRGV
ncbi:MAG: hypothetical protein AVDCRST_MAG11-1250, partial [uncultured Gemmatimonadaceae bacterium]